MIASVDLTPRRPFDLSVVWPALSALSALVFGVGLVFSPAFAFFGAAGLAIGPFLLVCPRLRLAFVVFGGLLTLQSSQSLSLLKFVYLGGVGGAALGALLALQDPATRSARAQMRPLFRISVGLLALIAVSLVQALVRGTSPVGWLRDVSPYILLAAVPLFVVDASAHVSRRWLVRGFGVAGALACLSFSVTWLERHHLAGLPIDRLLFPSAGLAIGFLCYAFAQAQRAPSGRTRWAVAGAVLLALLLVTGTRTNLLVVVAPAAMVIADRQNPGRIVRFCGRVGIVVLLAVVARVLLSAVAQTALTGATDRLASVTRVVSDPIASQSLHERMTESRLAWDTFTSAPLDGVGPGHIFVWRDQFGYVHSGFTMDTALLFLTKFGVLGVGLLLFALHAGREFARGLGVLRLHEPARLALVGYMVFWLVALPLLLPFEDKGFGLALIFLLALVILERRVSSDTEAERAIEAYAVTKPRHPVPRLVIQGPKGGGST